MGNTILLLLLLVIFNCTVVGVSVGMAMIPIAFTVVSLSTFSLDDAAKWDTYVLTAPGTKRRVVLAKYCSTFLMTIMGAALSVIIALVALLIRHETWSSEITFSFLASIGITLCLNAFLLPLVYRFGTDRARIFLMLLIFIPIGVVVLLKTSFPTLPFFNENALLYVLLSLPLVGIFLSALSYFISRAIYARKEF